jgi:signal peptidase
MATQKKNNNFISKLVKLLYFIVIAFVCLISVFLIYYIVDSQLHANDEDYKPGVSIYTIVSPSMTPVIHVYDVVVNVKTSGPTDIQIGDIITYKSVSPTSEGMTITHRVVNIDQLPDGSYEFITQGDNNSEPDAQAVSYNQIIGKEIFIIPYLGKLQFLIASQKGWLFLLLIPIGIYLIKEFFKLIDLFGLRKRVNRVVGTTQESSITKRIEENIIRKEKIKEELKFKQDLKESRIKNELEPLSFLEEYNETTVTVDDNRYIKPTKTPRVIEAKAEEVEATPVKEEPKVTKKTEKIDLPKPKKIEIEDEYEILDTNDLSSKIKEYDNRIESLDKMIKDMDNITQKKPTKRDEKAFVESDNYLSGSKIKVSKIVETKNQKKEVQPRKTKTTTKKTNDLNVKIELKPVLTNLKNDRLKVERPVSEDINELRDKVIHKETEFVDDFESTIEMPTEDIRIKKTTTKEIPEPIIPPTSIPYPIIQDDADEIKIPEEPVSQGIKINKEQATKKSKKLNLNPKEVKVVNRGKKTTKKAKKKLNLNPKEVTKINRDPRKKKPKKRLSPLPKGPLISIEKIK